MDRKKKIRLMLFFVFEVLTVFIICGGVIYLVRYQIRNKYNVRPEKICNRYLEKTYGKKFTMIDKTYISNYRDYHIWGFKYKDEEGIEFWEYYGYPYEYVTGSGEWFYNEKEYGEDHIRDNYWWTVLRNGDEFNLETYEFVDEFGLWGYVFPLEDEKDIEQLVQMISRLYIYTLNHVKEVSSQVIFCKIKFQENIRGYIISDDWMNLTDEEKVYNFVHEQIRTAWEESERFDIEEAMSVIETAQAEIDLKYIPEMGYDKNIQLGGPYKMGDNRYNVDAMQKKNYACWKDWLIIGNEVYKKQEDGRYKRYGEYYLEEMFETSYLRSDFVIRQYENYLIFYKQKDVGYDELVECCFCIYDLDTEKMVERDDFLEEGGIYTSYTLYGAPSFYVFDGKIFYRPEDCKSIRTIDLSNGKNEEFYSLDNTAYQRIGDFVIREDGAVMAVFWGEGANPDDFPTEKTTVSPPRHIEYWCIEPGEDGIKETKIGETDDFSGSEIQVARDGLVLDGYVPEGDKWESVRSCHLKENGEMTSIALRGHGFAEVRCVEDGFYYFDSTEYPETEEEPRDYRWHINAISKYDFHGNKIETYCLADPAKLEEGYMIIEILIYDGKATAFFVDENEEYLYISQVPVGLETEMPADGTEQIMKLQGEGSELLIENIEAGGIYLDKVE